MTADLATLLGLDADRDWSWREDALCAQTDPDAFYPEKGGTVREARRICAGCPVTADCLQAALDRDERHGVWGGMTPRERRRLTRPARTRRGAP